MIMSFNWFFIRVLDEGPWNFDKKLLIFRPCVQGVPDPPLNFDSTHFHYHISGLPPWCYTPEIGRRLAAVPEDSTTLEICSSTKFCCWSIVWNPGFIAVFTNPCADVYLFKSQDLEKLRQRFSMRGFPPLLLLW